MIINHNLPAINTYRQLGINNFNTAKSLEKLSSGLRINRAGDDAAGLAISEKMRAQVRGLDQAGRNAQDGISLIQTAEGALNETHSILQRMRELADQSANGTNTADDRKAMQTEVGQLSSEIDRIGNTTEFNTQKLLNGSLQSAGGVVGTNSTTGAQVAKLTAGTFEAADVVASGDLADTDFVEETLTIDGTDIKVNWANLSADDKSTLKSGYAATDLGAANKVAGIIANTINAAIDASGVNVAHISAYSDASGIINLESGSKGIDSNIDISANTVGTGVIGVITGTATAGTTNYNGTATTAQAADLKVNGALMQLTLPVEANGTEMATVASDLQASIKTAVDAYNTALGKSDGEEGYIKAVTVTASKDGRLMISSDSGPVTLADRYGNTGVADLGLSAAQTEAAGNGGMTFQIGANQGQTLTFGIGDMRSAALGVNGLDVSTATSASSAISTVDRAIQSVSSQRASLGAVQNRLEHTISNLGTSSENLTAAESRIRDVDMAKEMMAFQKNSILSQAATAMLAQANQQPQGVLQLLQ